MAKLLVSFLVLILSAVPVHANDLFNDELVEKDVLSIFEAMNNRDFKHFVKMTHPVVIDMMGGADSAVQQLEVAFNDIRLNSFKVTDIKLQKPFQYRSGTERDYVIVPMKCSVQLGEEIGNLEGFQLGILERNSKQWTFIDGDKLSVEALKLLFDDFPEDISFPEIKKEIREN